MPFKSANMIAVEQRLQPFNIGWPLFVEMLFGLGVGVVGTVLAASLSDTAGATLALTNQVGAMLFVLFRIIGAGVGVVMSHRLGDRSSSATSALAETALGISFWLGLGLAILVLSGGGIAMRLMNAPSTVAEMATPLMHWLAVSIVFDALNACLVAALRTHLYMRDCLVIILAMHSLHLALALPLMGIFDSYKYLPSVGLTGFTLAQGVSRFIGCAFLLHLWRRRLQIRVDWSCPFHLRRAELMAILHIGLPSAVENISWRLAFTASVAAVGLLGIQALATQAYLLQISGLLMLFSVTSGLTMELIVSRLVGQGQLRNAFDQVQRALLRSILISGILSFLVALAGPLVMRLFTRNEQIVHDGAHLLWLSIALEMGRTFNLIMVNALRAAGDVRYPLVTGMASMLVVMAGGSWGMSIGLDLGLAGVWLAYAIDEWLRGLLMWLRWYRLRWVPHARYIRQRRRMRCEC